MPSPSLGSSGVGCTVHGDTAVATAAPASPLPPSATVTATAVTAKTRRIMPLPVAYPGPGGPGSQSTPEGGARFPPAPGALRYGPGVDEDGYFGEAVAEGYDEDSAEM